MKTIEQMIGNTPMVKLESFSSTNCNIYAKLEGQNIGGSVKDRVALALIKDLEKKSEFNNRTTIYEPSSGNTGIGLAMIGAAKGYKVKIVLPENATTERVSLLKYYGAEVEFCSKDDWSGEKAIIRCKNIAQQSDNMMMPNQYENPVCVDVHYQTTGAEIIDQCPNITHLISTMGTGGTITGVSKILKERNEKIEVVGVEVKPNSSISGPRNLVHYVPLILDFNLVDKRVMIEDEQSVFDIHSKLAKKEGLFVGFSSAATLKVSLDISNTLNKSRPSNIVCIFPDNGDRYLSTLNNY